MALLSQKLNINIIHHTKPIKILGGLHSRAYFGFFKSKDMSASLDRKMSSFECNNRIHSQTLQK